jgi:hypothetical protein
MFAILPSTTSTVWCGSTRSVSIGTTLTSTNAVTAGGFASPKANDAANSGNKANNGTTRRNAELTVTSMSVDPERGSAYQTGIVGFAKI